jgi:hypothetical protein
VAPGVSNEILQQFFDFVEPATPLRSGAAGEGNSITERFSQFVYTIRFSKGKLQNSSIKETMSPLVKPFARIARKLNMSYESPSASATVAGSARHRKPISSETFYGTLSFLLVLIVFVGFAPTFYLRTFFNGPPVPPLNVAHGVLTTILICLVPVQAFLMRARQRSLHRYLGWTSAGLAAFVVSLTPVVMLRFIPRLLGSKLAPLADLEVGITQIFISDLIALPIFAGMFIAAIVNRHRTIAHQRWIMYASLMLATPAPGRAGFLLGVGFLGLTVVPLFAIVCAIFDHRTLRRVHPSTKLCLVATVGHAIVPLVLSAFNPVVQFVVSLG